MLARLTCTVVIICAQFHVKWFLPVPCCAMPRHCVTRFEDRLQGSKLARVDVVYTPWANLRKTASMAVGQACAAHAIFT